MLPSFREISPAITDLLFNQSEPIKHVTTNKQLTIKRVHHQSTEPFSVSVPYYTIISLELDLLQEHPQPYRSEMALSYLIIAQVILGIVFSTKAQLEEPENFICQRQVNINPSPTGCNCSAIEGMLERSAFNAKIESELEFIKKQLKTLTAVITDQKVKVPTDCTEAAELRELQSGVITIQPSRSGRSFEVYCDVDSSGVGWTVFQRRMDGSVDFYLDFVNYSQGFGDLEGEFWLGNDNLAYLTAQGEYELRIDLSDFQDNTAYAIYDLFRIGDASGNYRLELGTYSGTAGDSMTFQNNMDFSTKDRDNDVDHSHCAQVYHGAWWYSQCHESNLNGEYYRTGSTGLYAKGIVWNGWKGYGYSLKTTELKLRKKN